MTFSDRLAIAGVSFAAALITAGVVAFVAVMGGGDLSVIPASVPWAVTVGCIAALVAFIAGPVRAAAWWGVVWGTEDPEKHRGFAAAVLIAIIVVCVWALLR